MSEELQEQQLVPIEEQISQELVKQNVTEAVIAGLKEKYGHLKIEGIEDRETYDRVKTGRKECKAFRVLAKKICEKGREDAVAIQKAWVKKQKDVTDLIAEIEDPLEEQEKAYEAAVAKDKEERKRKQEEQLITRQQTLTSMGALYSDGHFRLGDVSFELSLVKESEPDIWEESILPKFQAEYEKVEAEQIEKDRLKAKAEAELKRQQEELEQKQKELAEKEADLKKEAERQADEARKAREARDLARTDQLLTLGLRFDFVDHFNGYGCFVPMLDLRFHDDEKWSKLIQEVTMQVDRKKHEEAEEKRKEQEREELQNKRYAELLPFKEYGEPVEMDGLWSLTPATYSDMLGTKKAVFDFEQEEQKRKIAEDAAKKERERIEEEQRQAELKRVKALGEMRMGILKKYNADGHTSVEVLGNMNDITWEVARKSAQDIFDELTRKQEELLRQQRMDAAKDKEKWEEMMQKISEVVVYDMRSSQYRKKAMILREKLEEIKAL